MSSKEFRAVHHALVQSSHYGVSKILEILSQEPDLMVRTMVVRRFKLGRDLPYTHLRVAGEFKALGKIYDHYLRRKKIYRYRRPAFTIQRKEKGLFLSKEQERKADVLLKKAIIWTYRFWGSSAMAKVMIRGGGDANIDNLLSEYSQARRIPLETRNNFYDLLYALFK